MTRIFRIHRWDTEQYAELHRFAPAAHPGPGRRRPGIPEYLAAHLRGLDIEVQTFADSNELLAHTSPFSFNFYILDLMLPGVDGVELIRIPRRRTQAGLLVVSGRLAPDVFSSVVDAGADMHLAKPASFDQVVVAIRAVHRRVTSYSGSSGEWLLDRQAGRLIAPDGVRIDLSDLDLAVMERFVAGRGPGGDARIAVPPPRPPGQRGARQHAQRDHLSPAPAHRTRHREPGAAAGAVARRLRVPRAAQERVSHPLPLG